MKARPYCLTAAVSVATWSSIALSVLAADIRSPQAEMPPMSEPSSAPGSSVDELLAIGKSLNPGLAVAALDAQTAQVRIGTTGRYPDPMFQTEFEDITGKGTRYAPDTLGRVKYTVEQTIPLWGKLDLQRKVAVAEADAASEQRRSVENELAARIKSVFAGLYATLQAVRINEELLDTVAALAQVAQSRYAQGQGGQQDAITAELERGRLQAELARLNGERLNWIAQMNALLNRPLHAPLAAPRTLRPVPDIETTAIGPLIDRALQASPQLGTDAARITVDERTTELVRRNWYPDVTLSLSVFDRDANSGREFGGYEAMVSFALPLQWGLRRAQLSEAATRLAASRARRDVTRAELQGQIGEAYAALVSARQGERILRDINVPQAKVVLQSALASYQLGRVDLPTVLLAEQGVLRVTLDQITLTVEQQVRLAALERVLGGDL